jgi:nucleotide-binding universal stress UspA family protein
MQTIRVLAGGSETDASVIETAFAVAGPLHAHLDFLHIRLSAGEAAPYMPHVDFAQGAALHHAMDGLRASAAARSSAAQRHFRTFCGKHGIEIRNTPPQHPAISASWHEKADDASAHMMLHARHSDLVVLGRPSRANGLPKDVIERLLLGCGRPLLLAPPQASQTLTGTALVAWKETPEAARALAAALPVLAKCKRVVIATIDEPEQPARAGAEVVRHLAWHGIAAEALEISDDGRPVAAQLESAAADCAADLLVMGAYGRSRMRELLFGGCTQHFVAQAERAVFLMH